MNPTDDHRDDEQFEALLAAAGRDNPPPDPAFLERLREQSTEVFLSSFPQTPLRNRGRLMIARALRLPAASAAALVLVAAGLYWYAWVRNAEPAFGQVLDNAARARTIHCRVTRGDETFEVWAEQAGRLRADAPDGTYQVAGDGKLWQVDEKANRATVRPSPYHRDGDRHELNLLALLLLPGGVDRASLEGEQPAGRVERDGLDCLVYRVEVPAREGAVEIEALVDRATGLPHSLEVCGLRGGKKVKLAAMDVLAYNQAVPEEKFAVRDTLTEDGRVGKIADAQGVVTLKPVMHQRWTPVSGPVVLEPGDWVRADARGANAAALRLVKNTRVIAGPGTLVEIVKPDRLRLHAGQLEVTAPEKAGVEVLGPGEEKIAVKGTLRCRVEKEKLVRMADEPRWLAAFKGKTNNESIGSLIAGIDGRNVPLTVGEHKVAVDVRDQIARTTIEETFVNHTNGVLEGVFHFPLPAGASVSGFAMWIGDKMIEADVVEKQRAREIYETILLEKRDPGLLEWTGGNVFKARVYPIFAHSEKRVRITYTQVLPLTGGRYRYSCALQSELLQQHPLRDLAIDVKVHSAVALKSVTCPTHPARLDRSLGWTDLDRAFASALQRCGPETQIIYIGDGIVTARDGDAVAFAKQLRALHEEKGRTGTFHAVATGSSCEAGVLKAIASLGGGSVRHVSAEEGPAAVALELLGEMVFPTVRDLKVEFKGLRTASVYPEQLPNLPAGSQHVLLGRYLPEGRDRAGEVIVTGTRGGEAVRFSARVTLADAEKGNAFIPRLWARMHLDHLLEGGFTSAARDEIIALSEEYNILTPYTSLLVLESDADRERFGVKTRFRMRDGERFFAQGRDNANYELKQRQMKKAGDWRLDLRRDVLRQLAELGRDVRRFPVEREVYLREVSKQLAIIDGMSYTRLGRAGDEMANWSLGMNVFFGSEDGKVPALALAAAPVEFPAEPLHTTPTSELKSEQRGAEANEADKEAPADPLDEYQKPLAALAEKGKKRGEGEDLWFAEDSRARGPMRLSSRRGLPAMLPAPPPVRPWSRPVAALFPNLFPATHPRGPKPAWPAEALALARSLLRTEKLAKIPGGLQIVRQTEAFDVRWQELASRSRKRVLLSPAAWLVRSEGDGERTLVQWWDGRERGIFSPAFQLGRVRAAAPGDGNDVPLDLGDYSLSALEQTYGKYTAALEPQKDGRALLVLAHPSDPQSQVRILVDTERHVIVRIEQHTGDKTTSVAKFEDFIERVPRVRTFPCNSTKSSATAAC
jgi:hypothetical protein